MNQDHPVVESTIPHTVSTNNKMLLFLLTAVSVGLCIFAFIIAYVFSRNNTSVNTTTDASIVNEQEDIVVEEEENAVEDTDKTIETKEFKGEYIQATIPTDWSIKEYEDKSGLHQSFPYESTFSGLTGFEIYDNNDIIVYSSRGIIGLGGAGGCEEISKFSDTEQKYIDELNNINSQLSMDKVKIIDLTNTEYTPIFTLGLRLRRVDSTLYLADNENLSAFNPVCGISEKFAIVPDISFKILDADPIIISNNYSYEINKTAEEETLSKLDDVLNSLRKV